MSKIVSKYEVVICGDKNYLSIPNVNFNKVVDRINKLLSKGANTSEIISDISKKYSVRYADEEDVKTLVFN